MRIIRLKNLQNETDFYCGQAIESGTYYQAQTEQEIVNFASDLKVHQHLFSDPVKLQVGDENQFYSDSLVGLKYLQGNTFVISNIETPSEIIPTTTKNEHQMQPWGCVKGYFESRPESGDKYICSITLSNKSEDGLTFNYNSDIEIVPTIGNYVFQDHETKRSWITSVDLNTQTVTFELPDLIEGEGVYSKGYYVDCLVRDWTDLMYLWGESTISVLEHNASGVLETRPCGDFIELSVLDKLDLFKSDEVCLSLFGVPASGASNAIISMGFEDNGEYGHWTKYYDESWVLNCNAKLLKTIDGAPGALLPNLYLRLSFFTTENENHSYHLYMDYYPTSKS